MEIGWGTGELEMGWSTRELCGWFRVLGNSEVGMGGLLGKWEWGIEWGWVLGIGGVGMVTGVRY